MVEPIDLIVFVAIAYLDGEYQVLLCVYYTELYLPFWRMVNLKQMGFDSNMPGNEAYAGQEITIRVGDVMVMVVMK